MNQDTTSPEINFDLVFVTNVDHLYTLSLSLKSLVQLYTFRSVHIVTNRKSFKFFANLKSACGSTPLHLVDEDTVLPDMTLAQLSRSNTPCFPKRAGWYFQQFLKLGVSKLDSISENYVVVDADTIFLKKIPFIDSNGKFVFTVSSEFNQPYFTNYELLLKEDAKREFSFISQYMVFNKKHVNSLLDQIEINFNHSRKWYWLIMDNIKGEEASLFSEYETYGHFMKNHHPELCGYFDAQWLRLESNALLSYFPNRRSLKNIPSQYYYVSYEQRSSTISGKVGKRFCKYVVPYLLLMKHALFRS